MGAKPAGPLWLLIALQAAISGASLVVEIVAGRMIAPYVGMSLYTWTAIIAVVLAGFSVGHWWGGRIAARPTPRALAFAGWTMVGAALTTGAAALVLRAVAGPLLQTVTEPLTAITLLATAAFFLPSLFAGVPAPILAVAAMRGRDGAERALGAMFAAGAVGAIGGTLLAGFLFVSWLGSAATLAAMTATYALAAALLFRLAAVPRPEAGAAAAGALAALGLGLSALLLGPVCDRESRYYCIRTVDLSSEPADPVRLMVLDHLAHGISAREAPRVMFTPHTAMLDALPRMRLSPPVASFHIGGGSYSVPRAWADRDLGPITVAEIDPEVTAQAAAQFWFDPGTARVIHRDARAVLRDEAARYDVIVGDAFTDIAVPAHLVTEEFFGLVADRLTDRGLYAMNVVDDTSRMEALAALVVTLRRVFPSVEVWTEAHPPGPAERRVFVILAGAADSPVSRIETRAPAPTPFAALEPAFLDDLVARLEPTPLTDDFAPIDRLVGLTRLVD
ncbi:spermidine synthase [Rhodovulum sp. 12E13]|uniref:fused MFS/spermidine synthase n=1 Tax=Rhodovulum sp. 12E13 TaxID=2203891 RepID=UPI000E15DB11|nr:fused MFS/spermidine synthase [Rhodovulum sp. 12E13]RDC74421.1 spermidine synthase [Rhodovulum sp. 12E13]